MGVAVSFVEVANENEVPVAIVVVANPPMSIFTPRFSAEVVVASEMVIP
jgi:hypothetical protein